MSVKIPASSAPDTKVLAIASHVTYGYVGNTMATFVMQTLGCEVAAINTVNFRYQQFKGTKTPAIDIKDLYDGLKASHLTDFDVLLSGYIPSIEALDAVADIAKDLRDRAATKPGSFFWVLDPVMGDQGRLYVSEELVAGYKTQIRKADLLLPNQFEVEILTGVGITRDARGVDLKDIAEAIQILHQGYGTRHVVVTSVRLKEKPDLLCIVGSSARSNGESRIFTVEVPVLDCFFSGTGDMFAALMVGRLREACYEAGTLGQSSWVSDDEVQAVDLPLAKATCRVLSSMQMVLEKTMISRNKEMDEWNKTRRVCAGEFNDEDENFSITRQRHLASTKAAEVRVVKNAQDLAFPEKRYLARPLSL